MTSASANAPPEPSLRESDPKAVSALAVKVFDLAQEIAGLCSRCVRGPNTANRVPITRQRGLMRNSVVAEVYTAICKAVFEPEIVGAELDISHGRWPDQVKLRGLIFNHDRVEPCYLDTVKSLAIFDNSPIWEMAEDGFAQD